MRLEGLHVREARGLPDGLRAGFDGAELVLVHGPNGIGKSSLVRVVRSLLWPKSASGEDRAEATWRTGGRSLRARLDRGEVTWTREGRPCEAPRLPDASLAGNYVLELRSLLRDSEEGFAARMRRELYGGIDIDAVERARPAPKRTERGTREKELAKAQAEVRHVTEKLAKGDASERRQKELERELAREGADEALLKRIELEQQHRAEEARREELAARLAEFPKRMETIQAGDTEEAREFETKVQQARSAKTQAERELVASRQEFECRGGGPDWREAVEGSALPTLETIRARLQAFKDAHRDACDRESPARVAAGEAGLAGPEEALGIDEAEGEGSTELADLEGVLREHARLEAKLDGLRIQLAVLGEEGEVEDGAGIEGAIPTLRRWLRVPDAVPGDSSGRRRMAFAMLGVGLAAAAVGGIAPWDWLLSAGLVLVACSGLVWWFGRGSSKGFDPEEVRRQIQQEFARLGIDGPEAWTPEGVERLLLSLERRRAELQDARVRADKQSAERARLHASIKNVEGALESNRTRREELLGRHGLDLEHTLDAAVALRKLEDARASRRAARKEALAWREAERVARGTWEELRTDLEAHGAAPDRSVPDPPAAEQAIRSLGERFEALEGLRAAETALRSAAEDLEGLEKRLRAFYAKRGLEDVEPDLRAARLRERVAARKEWSDVHAEHTTLTRKLDARTGADPDLGQLDDETLEQRKAEIKERRERNEDHRLELGKIRGELESLREGADLEEALEREARARRDLDELKERERAAECRKRLLAELRRELETKHAPAVLRRADELLRRFTHERNGLRLDREAGFLGTDVELGELRTLEELSDGTRAQCLLAIRLATIEREESGERLPLFLDEALVNADDERERAVIDALLAFSGSGEEARQVVYLTAQPRDVVVWRERARSVGRLVHEVDLGELVREQAAAVPADLVLPAVAPIPSPERGESLAAYGVRLGVRPLVAHRPAEGLDVVHLLLEGETDLLERLRRREIRTLGPIEREGDLARALSIDPALAEELRFRARAYVVFRDLWLRGRPPRLSSRELAECPAISDTYVKSARKLLAKLRGDAVAFLDAIVNQSLKGFRDAKKDELRDWLGERGWLPTEVPLEAAARRRELFERLGAEHADRVELLRKLDAMWAERAQKSHERAGEADPVPDGSG